MSNVVVNNLRSHTFSFINNQSFLHCSDLLKLFLVFDHLFVELLLMSLLYCMSEWSFLKEYIKGIKVQVWSKLLKSFLEPEVLLLFLNVIPKLESYLLKSLSSFRINPRFPSLDSNTILLWMTQTHVCSSHNHLRFLRLILVLFVDLFNDQSVSHSMNISLHVLDGVEANSQLFTFEDMIPHLKSLSCKLNLRLVFRNVVERNLRCRIVKVWEEWSDSVELDVWRFH